MRNVMIALTLMLGLLVPAPSQVTSDKSSSVVVQQALQDVARLKIGMQRKEVEKDFDQDGGMVFRSPTTYVYRQCGYIKIDVEFNFDPGVEKEFAPTDTITKVSKLYIDYPTND